MSFLLNRSIQENGELKIESKIEEIVEPLREKIRDLEKSLHCPASEISVGVGDPCDLFWGQEALWKDEVRLKVC